MFYQSRFYDPSLGRFTSADSIVPAGVQGLDRYAYVANNPVRYTDPTGHSWEDCGGRGGYRCQIHKNHVIEETDWKSMIEEKFGWNVLGKWSQLQLSLLYQAGQDVEASVAGGLLAMNAMFGHVAFMLSDKLNGTTVGGFTSPDGTTVTLDSKFDVGKNPLFAIVHELGHVWDIRGGKELRKGMQEQVHSTFGPGGSPGDGPGATGWNDKPTWNPGEDFAQSFAGYVYPTRANELSYSRHNIDYVLGINSPSYSSFRTTPRGQYIASQFPSPFSMWISSWSW